MKRLVWFIISAAFSTAAFASNVYVNVGGGYVIPSQRFSTTANSHSVLYAPTALGASLFNLPNVNWKNKFDNGYDANFAVGTEFFPGFRAEAEFFYQNMKRNISGSYDWNEVSVLSGDVFAEQIGSPISQTSTRLKVYSLLANFYYDFKNSTKLTPFIGAGVGVAKITSSGTSANNVLMINDETAGLHEQAPTTEHSPSLSGTPFAWQIKLGLAYEINHHLSIIANYRLFGTTNFHSNTSSIVSNPNTAAQAVFTVPGKSVGGLLTNAFELNVRYTFA